MSAPTAWLWVVAILISEWGHYAALAALLLAALSWRTARANALLAIVTAGLCLSPAIRAAWIARSLPARLTAAFGEQSLIPKRGPLKLLDLLHGLRLPEVTVTEVVYAMNGRKPLELDLYQAKNGVAPQPLIIVIHGGGWRSGSKKQLAALPRYLARRSYAVAAINYRHAPGWPFPAAVEDTFRAIDFLKANAVEYRLDPARVAIIGRSAGGQIALSAAYAKREPALRGVVAFYAPTDLVLGYQKPSRRWVFDSKKALENYLRGSPAENPEAYAAASPINFVDEGTPPTLLIHGALDPIVWPLHSELLVARLKAENRPHFYLQLPWATHGCEANLSGPSGQLSLYAIERFLAFAFSHPQPGAPAPARP
ncbi:MAG: alpha/beta hydrolase fold domain-containing protein [Chthoniobacterales bacterium]